MMDDQSLSSVTCTLLVSLPFLSFFIPNITNSLVYVQVATIVCLDDRDFSDPSYR